jgi:hypothetical protein
MVAGCSAPQSPGVATGAGFEGVEGGPDRAPRGIGLGTGPDGDVAIGGGALAGVDGGGMVIVGAAATADSSAVGTFTAVPQ